MHLTDVAVTPSSSPDKGDSNRDLPARAGTLTVAAELTGFSADSLRTDHVANICGGAAVLASYQPTTTAQQPEAWSKAVALYAGTDVEDEALDYADMVFDVLRSGASETTDAGDTVTLAARPAAALDTQAVSPPVCSSPASTRRSVPPRSPARSSRRSTARPVPRPRSTSTTTSPTARTTSDRLSGRAQHRVPLRRVHPADQGRGGAQPVRVLALHHSLGRRPRRPARRHAQRGRPRRQLVPQHALHRLRARRLRGSAGAPGTPRPSTGTPPSLRSTSPPSTASSSIAPTWSATTSSGRPPTSGTRAPTGTGSTTWSCWARRSSRTEGQQPASSRSSPGSPTTRSR